MTRKEQLRDNYEDALFALLMESVIEKEGKRLLRENERINADPAFEVPEEVNQRCIKTIKTAFAKKNRKTAGKIIYRVFSNVAAVVVLCGLLFTMAYAAIPEVRVKTLNLLIEVSDVSTKLTLQGKGPEADTNAVFPETSNEGIVLMGYQFPAVPEGFALNPVLSQAKPNFEKLYYEGENGSYIVYSTSRISEETPLNVDTQNTDYIQEIEIHGYTGLLIIKERCTHIVWADTDQAVFCAVLCKGLDTETTRGLASRVYFLGA